MQLPLVFRGFELFDLLYEVSLLVVELLVLAAVRVELGEEVHQLVLVPQQDVQDRLRLVGVRDEYFKNMERLKLYVPGLLFQHVHHELQVIRVGDVSGHDGEVVPVQQQLPQQLEALPPRHVVLRV